MREQINILDKQLFFRNFLPCTPPVCYARMKLLRLFESAKHFNSFLFFQDRLNNVYGLNVAQIAAIMIPINLPRGNDQFIVTMQFRLQ